MGHKVTVEKIDWGGLADKLESIEKPKNANSRAKRKLTYVISAVAISCLMIGTAFGMMISATTPTTPTVIEPGSMVSTTDYVMFADAGNVYLKSGQTGALTASSTSAYTILTGAIAALPHGGIIDIAQGNYTLANLLTVDTPGIVLRGNGPFPRGFDTISTKGTKLTGNFSLEANNIQVSDMTINGHVTLTSRASLATCAQNIILDNLAIKNGISFIGLIGTAATQVPFQNTVKNCYIEGSTGQTLVTFYNEGAPIEHIYIEDCILDQEASGTMMTYAGDFAHVTFQNNLFMCYYADETFFAYSDNLAGPLTTGRDLMFINCNWEIGADYQTVFNFSCAAQTELDIQVIGGWFSDSNHPWLLLYESEPYIIAVNKIEFLGVHFSNSDNVTVSEIARSGDASLQPVIPYFTDCYFRSGVVFIQKGTSQSVGVFTNNFNLNPIGKVTNILIGTTISCLIGTSPFFPNNTAVTVRDVPILLTVNGGTDVVIVIKDQNGNQVVPASGTCTSLNQAYVPIGYTVKITWGASNPEFAFQGT